MIVTPWPNLPFAAYQSGFKGLNSLASEWHSTAQGDCIFCRALRQPAAGCATDHFASSWSVQLCTQLDLFFSVWSNFALLHAQVHAPVSLAQVEAMLGTQA